MRQEDGGCNNERTHTVKKICRSFGTMAKIFSLPSLAHRDTPRFVPRERDDDDEDTALIRFHRSPAPLAYVHD
jgi:hypothetical protein